MGESNSSEKIAISKFKSPYSRPETSQFLNLPPELLLVILQLMSHEDQQTFSLLSHSSRQIALPFVFRKLAYCNCNAYTLAKHIEDISRVNEDIKALIRELTLDESSLSALHLPVSIVFQFLESLPNLRVFRWCRPRGVPTCLDELVASLQHCPLEHFEYWMPDVRSSGPVIAPSGLKSLALRFDYASLYALIQPSFSTLVELRIRPLFPAYSKSDSFDLNPLRPVGKTLQKFCYKTHQYDSNMLDTIPDVFPHLTTLDLMFWDGSQGPWEKSFDDAISRNTKLQYLTVSAGGYGFCDTQSFHRQCHACVDQRIKAAQALAMVCPGLKCCIWDDRMTQYMFDVKSRDPADGNVLVERVPSFATPRSYADSWFGGSD